MEAKRVVFLDKDGTLIPDIPYNTDPSLITLNDGVLEGLELLSRLGYIFILISNQSGIAKGYFKEEELFLVRDKIQQLLMKEQIILSGFYYCPHEEVEPASGTCDCRKPQPGLILTAAEEHKADLSQSWMIGDILDDIEAGNTAGCKSILIDNGNEKEWNVNGNLKRVPNWIASDFRQASLYIYQYHKLKDNENGAFEYTEEV